MRQLISNLVSNALKYSPAAKPIQIKLEATGEALRLTVQDEGIGIPADDMKRLFEPFHRGTNIDAIPGTGLGLSIAKEAVELHNGIITIDSQLGVGTTFTVLFPVAATQSVPVAESDKPFISPCLDQPQVLVIDDEPAVREVVMDILMTEGFPVSMAANGAEGIEYFRTHRSQIGLVLLDMKMPGLSGEETFRALRELDPLLKVVLSSGYSETEVHRHFSESGIVAFLQKPYNFTLLLQAVQTALAHHPQPVDTEPAAVAPLSVQPQ